MTIPESVCLPFKTLWFTTQVQDLSQAVVGSIHRLVLTQPTQRLQAKLTSALSPSILKEATFRPAILSSNASWLILTLRASYEWLVVSGAKARYRGVSTVNGTGSSGFELTAWDGQVSGGGGVDSFRIKIWNNNQGNAVVYDNMMGAADGANPTTPLAGGSIVIYTSAQPLLASGRTALAAGRGLLTQDSLNQAVDQAINYWSNLGVDASAVSKLQQIHVEVADLSDTELGIASDTDYFGAT